ncbi:MAG: hypothetical protein U7127_09185 [Phormidium sp.]
MTRQRLDALVVLTVAPNKNGHSENVKEAYLAHPVPGEEKPWIVSPPLSLDDLTEMDFDELVDEWESEFEEAGYETFPSQDIVSDQDRVLLVGLITEDVSEQRFQDGLAELVRLVESAGGEVLDTITQKRSRPHPQTVVGQGKVEEIAFRAHQIGANIVVFDRDISPSHLKAQIFRS